MLQLHRSPLLVALVLSTLAATIPARAAEPHVVRLAHDFVASYASAEVSGALDHKAGLSETAGKIGRAGIFLHPKSSGDAVVRYRDVRVPDSREAREPLLLVRLGMRDGIPWETKAARPNGVRFTIRVNDEKILSETVLGPGWKLRARSLSRWAGQRVDVSFVTNAIAGNSSYDWSVLGEPRIVEFSGTDQPTSRSLSNAPGVGLVEVECGEASRVRISFGTRVETRTLAAGLHRVPCEFTTPSRPTLRVEEGDARIRSFRLARFGSHLIVEDFALDSPLVMRGEPVTVIAHVRNLGKGRYNDSATNVGGIPPRELTIAAPLHDRSKTTPLVKNVRFGRIEPGEGRAIPIPAWTPLSAGLAEVSLGDRRLAFRVFELRPDVDSARPDDGSTSTRVRKVAGGAISVVENRWGRIRILRETAGHAYGILEHWRAGGWTRTGSLHPLVGLVLGQDRRKDTSVSFRVKTMNAVDSATLRIEGTLDDSSKPHPGSPWPVEIEIVASREHPRFRLSSRLTAPRAAALRSFRAPQALAGDRFTGASKDFAIFPGVEFLEGDEESSSTRDLAYPLSDRRVPATYKVATPLIAVESKGCLTAILWDPRREWTAGQENLAARFVAPAPESGYETVTLGLSAPPVGDRVPENSDEATRPLTLRRGQELRLDAVLVLDQRSRYPSTHLAREKKRAGLVLQAMRHRFEEYGLPEPSPPPRSWEEQKALSRHAYLEVLWQESPAGWGHCQGWPKGLFVSHAVPLLLDQQDGASPAVRARIEDRISRVITRATRERGKGSLWRHDGCHILVGELPFRRGYLGENLRSFIGDARGQLRRRQGGLWRWQPSSERHASLGERGAHTLGQAARPAFEVLRAARLSGDAALAREALDALKQLGRYSVPRGAQTWECPVMQPDILAAGWAVRAYCEAYRLTGDSSHLGQARYWAWTGLPFLYTWELEGYPTMRYNAIAVMGSTFHTHSWIGLPVVWCGLVYAYALQDLAQYDDSFPWQRVAQGVTRSAMWQQYTEGKSKGCYPDSWHMVDNAPKPADINPEDILVNEFRLRGLSPEISHARVARGAGFAHLNSAARSVEVDGEIGAAGLRIRLEASVGFPLYSLLAPVEMPSVVRSAAGDRELKRVASSDELANDRAGWLYDAGLEAVILKTTPSAAKETFRIAW